jgi:hypothetical protein
MSRSNPGSWTFLTSALSLLFVLAASSSSAAPFVVVEEDARLVLDSAGSWFGPDDVAVDGDRIAMVTSRIGGGIRRQVHLFERNASGAWTYTGQVLEIASEFRSPSATRVDIQGNLIAVTFMDALHVLELANGSWQHTSISTPPGIRIMGGEVSIDAGRIVVSAATGNHEALEFRKNASGVWAFAGRATGDPLFRDVQWNGFLFTGGDVEIAGDSILLGTPFGNDDPMHDRAFVFRQVNGAWIQSQVIERDSASLTAFIGNAAPWVRRGPWVRSDGLGGPTRVQYGRP